MTPPEFLTTRQAATRLGFSLGTVQNMVESGKLEAWKTGGGHRRIPRAAVEALLNQRQNSTPGRSGADTPIDILISEDDTTLQLLYQLTIEGWELPITLRLTANGFEGLLQVGKKTPDILIADLMMPGMDGFEMINQLRSDPALSNMDIIVVSAIDRSEIEKRGLPANVTVFTKPIPFHEIKGFILGRLAAKQRSA
jgi:excisionase family DNA binding protein